MISSSVAVAAAQARFLGLRDRLKGTPVGLRARRAYDQDARFLRDLGHDPELLLGPAPTVSSARSGAERSAGGASR